MEMSLNTIEVLKRRYLLKDDNHRIIETPDELFRRVAHHIADAEKSYRRGISPSQAEEKFYLMMRNLEFMPNSPTLMNAGTTFGQLSACFVLPVEDSIDGIFKSLKGMAKIHQTGGGTGFNFSHLRPKGDLVCSTKGEASGPVSFMSIFNQATGVIVQGGRRRGANMGILRCDHPDIVEFIEVKNKEGAFSNFNLSVGITDKFMHAVLKREKFALINPRTKKETGYVDAVILFDILAKSAWKTGDPGLVFLDEINRKHPLKDIGYVETTNPCGELPLLPFESCNLASINLAKMVTDGKMDWQKLKDMVRWGIRFLDDVIEVNKFPLSEIKEITLANRKIGLGVMGFADMLIKLGVPYTSSKAIVLTEELMRFIHRESILTSQKLAEERGTFINFEKSIYAKKNIKMRNATVNTIAPTGTISIIADCSSGIEPLFALSFVRNVLSGTRLLEVNQLFETEMKKRNLYIKGLMSEVARGGSIQKIKEIPKGLKRIFVTAFDITPKQHLEIQSAFQKYTDNSVSKTVNLPANANVSDIKDIYLMAHKLRCKGITIYRYGSKKNQVLTFGYDRKAKVATRNNFITAGSEYSGGCASGICPF
jgi:ribonucleoside-diphosphate reductase alpha chain